MAQGLKTCCICGYLFLHAPTFADIMAGARRHPTRIGIILKPKTYEVLKELAAVTGDSMASFAASLVDESEPVLREMVEPLRTASIAKQRKGAFIVSQLRDRKRRDAGHQPLDHQEPPPVPAFLTETAEYWVGPEKSKTDNVISPAMDALAEKSIREYFVGETLHFSRLRGILRVKPARGYRFADAFPIELESCNMGETKYEPALNIYARVQNSLKLRGQSGP